jgi:ABC-type spermidine/putrescine transport system permease subunit I
MKKSSKKISDLVSIVPLRLFGCCLIAAPIYFLIKEIWPFSIKELAESFNEYKDSILLSIKYGIWTSLINLTISLPLAWIIYKKKGGVVEKLYPFLLIIPLFGGIYIAFGFFYLFIKGGMVSKLFSKIGVDTISILYSSFSIIIALTILTLPFMLNAIINSVNKIPKEEIVAARILGANELVILKRIIIPQSAKGILSGLFMTLGWTLSVVEIPLLLGNFPINEVFSVKLFRNITTYYEYRQAAYISLIFILGIFLLSLSARRLGEKKDEI